MCVFFIVLMFISPKFNVQSHYKEDNPESQIRDRASSIKHLLRQRRISFHSTSTINHLPFLLFLLPGLWFLVTSLWSPYPEVSAMRALYFILISTGCISAGVLWIRYSGRNFFELLLPANVVVVLLCVFSLITNIPFDSWTAGHGKGFMGFFGHQNLLASVLLFTLPAVFSKLWKPVNGKQIIVNSIEIKVESHLSTHYSLLIRPWRDLAFGGLLTANLLLLTLTYSRSSILSLVIGAIVFLILNKNWEILSYSFVAAAVITSIIYLTPAVNNFAHKILKKDFPEVYSSRMWMWEPSYKAALEGGLFGLGYGISHPEIRSGEYSDRFEDSRLIREKGNSSLALVEETGTIGLILFILPVFYLLLKFPDTRSRIPDKDYKSGIRNQESPFSLHYDEAGSIRIPVSSILIASITAFILHAQFEAWWVGVGSVQLPLFFIYIGLFVQGLIVQGPTFTGSKF